jgi:hypothetical protein
MQRHPLDRYRWMIKPFKCLEWRAISTRSRMVFSIRQSRPTFRAPDFCRGASERRPDGVSFTDVELLQGNRVQFRHAGIRLDLGGIAKGFAVDEAITALRTAGLESGLVNAGGDLRAFGRHLSPVEIQHPCRPGNTLAALAISNQAVATSGHYFADRLRPAARTGTFVHPRFVHSKVIYFR